MSEYPRIKKFTFDYKGTYRVPSHHVGRLDRIATELYGSPFMYKPLAAANFIAMPLGFRVGVRKTEDALRLVLAAKGYSGTELESEFNRIMDNKRLISLDWYDYSDNSYGVMSEVREGMVLRVPTLDSCDKWLKLFEALEVN